MMRRYSGRSTRLLKVGQSKGTVGFVSHRSDLLKRLCQGSATVFMTTNTDSGVRFMDRCQTVANHTESWSMTKREWTFRAESISTRGFSHIYLKCQTMHCAPVLLAKQWMGLFSKNSNQVNS